MPAAAVIPAPIAYIKVVAVKKLVVGFLDRERLVRLTVCTVPAHLYLLGEAACSSLSVSVEPDRLL